MTPDPLDQPRTFPHSEESERAVLAGALLDADAARQVDDELEPEDFYLDRHRLVAWAIHDLLDVGDPVDIRTVQAHLEAQDKLEAAGGLSYIAGLDLDLPDLGRIGAYCDIIRERATLRRIIQAAQETIRDALDGSGHDASQLAGRLESTGRDLSRRAAHGTLRPLGAAGDHVLDRLRSGDTRSVRGPSTGIPALDRLTHGLVPGRLVVVAGRPGMGKSSLKSQIARHVALEEGIPTAVFSLEMGAEELALRDLSALSGVPSGRIRSGTWSTRHDDALSRAQEAYRAAPLLVDDRPAGPRTIAAECRRQRADRGLGLVVIDYLQLMEADGRHANRNLELAAITRQLKLLARELQITILLGSQLSRDPERRGGDHRPRLADLRDSGAVEQDADLVLGIYRDEVYNPDDPESTGRAEIIVLKNRNGETGTVHLAWHGETTSFTEPEGWGAAPAPHTPPPPTLPGMEGQAARNTDPF